MAFALAVNPRMEGPTHLALRAIWTGIQIGMRGGGIRRARCDAHRIVSCREGLRRTVALAPERPQCLLHAFEEVSSGFVRGIIPPVRGIRESIDVSPIA